MNRISKIITPQDNPSQINPLGKIAREEKEDFSDLSREQLIDNYKIAHTFVKVLASVYYQVALVHEMKGTSLPPQISLPTQLLSEAFEVADGRTLEILDYGGYLDSDQTLVSVFADRDGNQYVASHDFLSGMTALRSEEGSRNPVPPNPETHLWVQAFLMAAAYQEARRLNTVLSGVETVWTVVEDLLKLGKRIESEGGLDAGKHGVPVSMLVARAEKLSRSLQGLSGKGEEVEFELKLPEEPEKIHPDEGDVRG